MSANLTTLRNGAAASSPALPAPAPTGQRLPLSVSQRGMWVGHKIAGNGVVFNLAEAVEIHGPVDEAVFLDALQCLSQEAETLRVRIVDEPTGPIQWVRARFEEGFRVVDFSAAAQPWQAAQQHMQHELMQPVDLARDPLWVCQLLKLGPAHHVWYHRAHHIILDGYSASLLSNRLAVLYSALIEQREPPTPDFGELAELLHEEDAYRRSERFERDRRYWHEQMRDLPDPVTLATRPSTGMQGLLRRTARLSPDSTRHLQRIAQASESSLPQLLIALAAAFYYRCTDAPDLVFGVPVTARPGRQLRRIPGMVANAVALRLAMAPELSLVTLAQQVAVVMRQALRHQQFRLEDLRRELGLVAQRKQIAWLAVNIEPFDYDLHFGGHPATTHNLSNGSVEDLTIFIYDRDDGRGLRVDFDANPGLYDSATLDRHLARFVRLVDALAQAPEMPIGEAPMLDASELDTLMLLSRGAHQALPAARLTDLFERCAAQQPDAPALVAAGRVFSYAALNAAANAWAQVLMLRGIGPGDRVAVALRRNHLLPMMLLAVLKAGAAYVPIDTELPADRVAMVLQDALPALLLTTHELQAQLPATTIDRVYVDEEPELSLPLPPGNLGDADRHRPLRPRDPAYVIFTSGSTGRPKGVVVNHANIVNLLAAMNADLGLAPGQRWLAVTTVSFDIAALEIFGPLTSGACVVLATRETVRDPHLLALQLRQQGIGIMQATPALWQMLLDTEPTALKGLRALVGGEALPGALAQALTAHGAQVINLYGPTETTVWSTAQALGPEDLATPPIGRPIWNTQTYVLDSGLQPVPIGMRGELYIGGAGVAAGYFNRRGLTADRFIPSPFGPAGSRLYRTGDHARWTADGKLSYLGRSDDQLKIRGFRIEAGDVEAAITRCAAVQRAVVTGHQPAGGATRLVAYCVPQPGCTLDMTALRRELATRLPEYMVPSVIVAMDSLPLTPNGKVNRKALPEPEPSVLATAVAPRTPLEAQLASLWARALDRPQVGVHDNFFDLGGDSLLAVALIHDIETLLGTPLSLATLFEAATIAELAERLATGVAGDPLAPLLALREQGAGAPLFCVHPVLGLGWAYAALLREIGPDHPVHALQAQGLRTGGAQPDSVQEMARDYITAMRRVQPQGPYQLLGWSFGGLVAFEMAAQLQQQGQTVGLLVMLDSLAFLPRTADTPDPVGDPSKPNPVPEIADEDTLVRAALQFLGLDTEVLNNGPMRLAELAEHLCGVYGVMSMPAVRHLQQQNEHLIEAVVRVIMHNLALARRHVPSHVRGELLYFEATQRAPTELDSVLMRSAQDWQAHLDGRLVVHRVAAHHQQMLEPGPLEHIGPLLAEALARVRSSATAAPHAMQELPTCV